MVQNKQYFIHNLERMDIFIIIPFERFPKMYGIKRP